MFVAVYFASQGVQGYLTIDHNVWPQVYTALGQRSSSPKGLLLLYKCSLQQTAFTYPVVAEVLYRTGQGGLSPLKHGDIRNGWFSELGKFAVKWTATRVTDESTTSDSCWDKEKGKKQRRTARWVSELPCNVSSDKLSCPMRLRIRDPLQINYTKDETCLANWPSLPKQEQEEQVDMASAWRK